LAMRDHERLPNVVRPRGTMERALIARPWPPRAARARARAGPRRRLHTAGLGGGLARCLGSACTWPAGSRPRLRRQPSRTTCRPHSSGSRAVRAEGRADDLGCPRSCTHRLPAPPRFPATRVSSIFVETFGRAALARVRRRRRKRAALRPSRPRARPLLFTIRNVVVRAFDVRPERSTATISCLVAPIGRGSSRPPVNATPGCGLRDPAQRLQSYRAVIRRGTPRAGADSRRRHHRRPSVCRASCVIGDRPPTPVETRT